MRSAIIPSWRCGCSKPWMCRRGRGRETIRALSFAAAARAAIAGARCAGGGRRVALASAAAAAGSGRNAAPRSAVRPVAEKDAAGEAARLAASSRVIDPATAGELNESFFTASVDERRLILLNLARRRTAGARSHPPVARPISRAAAAKRRRCTASARISCTISRAALQHSARAGAAYRARRSGRAGRGRGQSARHAARRALSHAHVRQSRRRPFGGARPRARRALR